MCSCEKCGRVLVYGWLRAVQPDGQRYERLDIRACSITCAEELGSMDGLVGAWRYEPAGERERRTA